MMNIFVKTFKNDREVVGWLRNNDPFGGDILYRIFDDAMMLETEPVFDGNSKPPKSPRKNPDLLSEDTASEFFAQSAGQGGVERPTLSYMTLES
jgi:hypothetical protein